MDLEKLKSILAERFRYDPETGELTGPSGKVLRAIDGAGYLIVGIGGRTYRQHRIIWLMCHGAWPKNEIDHINRNPSDNRIGNLRDVPHLLNMQNRGAEAARSGYPFIYRQAKSPGRYNVQRSEGGKMRYYGAGDLAACQAIVASLPPYPAYDAGTPA